MINMKYLQVKLILIKKDSLGDGVNDGDRKINYTIDNSSIGVNMKIEGSGNLPSTTITNYENSFFDGYKNNLYDYVPKTLALKYLCGAYFIGLLKQRIDKDEAPTIAGIFDSGLHGINALSIIQNNNNPNIYYIGVYDNNYPGKKKICWSKMQQKKLYNIFI